MSQSTSFAIVEQSLADILERLQEMPSSPRVKELLSKARAYERTVSTWAARAPSSEQRAAMLKSVLDLNVEVMQEGRLSDRELPKAPAPAAAARPKTGGTKR